MTNTKSFKEITSDKRYQKTKKLYQHGDFSVYDHSVYVCSTCFKLADKLHLKVDKEAMAKGALLHDYFLYDWHEKGHPRFHGMRHAKVAMKNAERDFGLTKKEANMIRAHMFPLALRLPRTKEAMLICLADKYCATRETIKSRRR